MSGLDLKSIFRESLQAISPIAEERKIDIRLENAEEPVYTTLPLDEVFGSVFFLLLRLVYILPENRELRISVLNRYDAATQGWFLQVEIRLFNMHINPNLIFKPDNNRFKLEQLPEWQTRIYIEWEVPEIEAVAKTVVAPQNGSYTTLEVADDTNASMLGNDYYDFFVFSRFKEYGKNAFVKEKINGTKVKKEMDFQQALLGCIFNHIHLENFDSDALGKKLGLSRTQLYRKIKELTGLSTANFIRQVRLKKSAELLETSALSVGEISVAVGFNEPSYFSSSFQELFHLSPTEWRKTKKSNTKT